MSPSGSSKPSPRETAWRRWVALSFFLGMCQYILGSIARTSLWVRRDEWSQVPPFFVCAAVGLASAWLAWRRSSRTAARADQIPGLLALAMHATILAAALFHWRLL